MDERQAGGKGRLIMELADGRYRARGVRAELGLTSKGNEQVGVELQLLGDGYEAVKLSWYGYFTDASFPITIKALRALGWAGDDLSDLSGIDTNEVELVVENEEYEGKVRPKVQFINALGGLGMKEPMPEDRKKSFAAAMRDRIKAAELANGQRKPVQKPLGPPRAQPSADDIPF
jgi:hypothetical protein